MNDPGEAGQLDLIKLPDDETDVQNFHGAGDVETVGSSLASEPGGFDDGLSRASASGPVDGGATAADVAIPSDVFENILFDAHAALSRDSQPKHPWEVGVFNSIFGDDPCEFLPSLPQVDSTTLGALFDSFEPPGQKAQREKGDASVGVRDESGPFYVSSIKGRTRLDLDAELDKLWSEALNKWYLIFDTLGFPGLLGEALSSSQMAGDLEASHSVLRDTMGIKSPRTCIKRAQTLLKYFAWLRAMDTDFLPWDRKNVIEFLETTIKTSKGFSLGNALLEALRFAHFVMGIPVSESLLKDPQFLGKVKRMAAEAAMPHQARALTVTEVGKLENFLTTTSNVIDVYLMGGVMFALLSRSRWSDLKHVDEVWLDRHEMDGLPFGFVEAQTRHHKTATTLAKKQRFMPLVAPLLGVTTTDWCRAWFNAMDALGVDRGITPVGAICRAPLPDGTLSRASCTSTEIGGFVNKVLGLTGNNKITSHSFKHTTLNWCSAYGMEETARCLLGHHEVASKPLMVYSRDVLSRPLQLYCAMLQNIRLDRFRPEDSRASRMLTAMHESANPNLVEDADAGSNRNFSELDESHEATTGLPQQQDVSRAHGSDQDKASSDVPSTDTDSSTDSDSSSDKAELPEIPGPLWCNKKSQVLHKCSDLAHGTACGRSVDEAHFVLLAEGSSMSRPRCARCFKGEVITNVSDLADALSLAKAKRQRL